MVQQVKIDASVWGSSFAGSAGYQTDRVPKERRRKLLRSVRVAIMMKPERESVLVLLYCPGQLGGYKPQNQERGNQSEWNHTVIPLAGLCIIAVLSRGGLVATDAE